MRFIEKVGYFFHSILFLLFVNKTLLPNDYGLKCNIFKMIFRHVRDVIPYSRCYLHILTKIFACLHDCPIKLDVILPCKIVTKTCWFLSFLLKRFLQVLVLFVFFKYNDAVSCYSIWYLKKYWVGGFTRGEFTGGNFPGGFRRGGGGVS